MAQTEENSHPALIDAASKIYCDESIHNIWRTFYESSEVLQRICNVHPLYEMIPLGTGFDGLPIPLYVKPADYLQDVLELKRPPHYQQMMCVHKRTVVLPADETSVTYDKPLVLHMEPVESEPGFCRLTANTDTITNLQNGNFELISNIKNSDHAEDEENKEGNSLSSEDFQNKFSKDCDIFLNINRRIIGTMNEKCQSASLETPFIRNRKEEGSLQNIHAMQPVGALFCPKWSSSMLSEWQESQGEAHWPPSEIRQGVPSLGFHVIPDAPKMLKINQSVEHEKDEAELEGETSKWKWRLSFRVAEQFLFKHLNTKQRQIVYCSSALLSSFREIHQTKELGELIRHSILRFLQNNAVDSSTQVLRSVKMFLEYLLQDLEQKQSMNYFIPTSNLLDNIPDDVIKELFYVTKSTLHHVLSSLTGSKYLPIQTYERVQGLKTNSISCDGFTGWLRGYGETIRKLLKRSLLQSFDDTTNLLIMTSFGRHHSQSVDASIATHEELIKILNIMKGELGKRYKLMAELGDIVKRFIMFVQVNLGTLYHTKMVTSETEVEQNQFYAKAEEYLQSGCKCDLAYGFIRLAHLYHRRGSHDRAIAFLNKMNKHLDEESGKGNTVSEDVYDNNYFGTFRKELWRPWIDGKYVFDIMFCRMLNPIYPAEMTQSFALAQCQMLGVRVQSIATFSPQFFSSYLLALCHMAQRQYVEADKILSNAEEACVDEPQTDLNDKRTATYLNIMARCYIRMENLGRARYVIHNSLRVFPSPRNPARFLRYQLDYGDSWGYVKQGLKFVIFSGLSYVIVQFVRGHFRNNNN